MSPILGFSFDASDFRTEIASVQNIVSQYEVLLSSEQLTLNNMYQSC